MPYALGVVLKKNRLFLLFVPCFFFLIVCFHKPMACFVLKQILCSQVSYLQNTKVSYAHIGYNKHSIYLDEISCVDRISKEERLHIDKLECLFSFKIKPLTFNTSYRMVKPSIKWEPSNKEKKWSDLHLHDLLSLQPIAKKLTLEKGKVECIRQGESITVYLSFEPGKESKHLGNIQLGFDREDAKHMEVALYKSYKEVLIQTQFHELPLSVIQKIFSSTNIERKGEVKTGTLQGMLQLGVTSEDVVDYFKSDLEIKEIALASERLTSGLEIKACKFHSYLPLDRQDKISIHRLSVPMLMQYLVSTLEVEGASFHFTNPNTHCVWQLENIEGSTTFNLEQTPVMHLKGVLEKDQIAYPFFIEGKGAIESEKNWRMDLDLCKTSSKDSLYTSIYLALLDQKEYFIKTHLDKLGALELNMLQDLLVMWMPSLDLVHLTQGSLSTDLTLQIQDSKLHSLSFESFNALDLKGKWKEKPLELGCSNIKGKVKLYFPLFNTSKASSWEVSFEDFLVAENNKKILLESSGFLSSKDWKMGNSWIKTKLEGIEGECSISGYYTQLEIAGSFVFHQTHLFSPFQEQVIAVSDQIQRLEKIDFSLKAKHEKEGVDILGTTHFNYSSNIVDKLRFGVEVSLQEIFKTLCCKGGWFQSDKLSENTYLWFIKYYKQRWHALGNMQVTGEFDDKVIHFGLESQNALYDSEDILVNMHAKDTLYKGDFVFDLQKKSWLINLPIKAAQCIDKRLHMPFEDVVADVKIEGMVLSAENIRATCEKVAFSGRLDLDFEDPEWIDLKLYPYEMKGAASDFIAFMHYIPEFAALSLPIEGKIEGEASNYLFVRYNLENSEKKSKIAFKLYEATCRVNESFAIEGLLFDLLWDSENNSLEIKDLNGEISLHNSLETRRYRLNVQNLVSKNLSAGEWDIDLRMEAPTLDVLRIAGHTRKIEEDFHIFLEPNLTHLFGAKLNVTDFILDSAFKIKELKIASEFSSIDLLNQLQWGHLCGFLDFKPSLFQDIKNTKTEGDISLKLSYNKKDEGFLLEVESPALIFDQFAISDLYLKAFKNDTNLEVLELKTKDVALHAKAEKQEGSWKISLFDLQWKRSLMTSKKGIYREGFLEIEIDKFSLILEELKQYYLPSEEFKDFFSGNLQAQGKISLNVSEGLKQCKMAADLAVFSDSITKAELDMVSKTPFKLSYQYEEGVRIENLNIHFKKEELEEVWAKIDLRQLTISLKDKTSIGKSMKVMVPPEMLIYLGGLNLLPHMQVKNKTISISGKDVPWDNQIDTELDFVYADKTMQIQGILKDGYYWIGDKSLYFQKFHYFLDQGQLNLVFGCDYQEISLDFLAKIQFKEELEAKVSIKEGHVEEHDERTSLEIACRFSEEEGFCLQSIEGGIYGVDFSFRRNPRAYLPYVMILTGQMKIDTTGLVKSFPKLFYQAIKDLGMGSGYELSGDWVFSKKDIKASYFKGFLKGRDFEFLGFYFKTLLSEVEMNSRGIVIHDFSLSDMSGVAQIKEAKVQKSEEDGSWKLEIPEIMVQDFRPSFLKKHEGQEERIKPFVIKDLHFFNIQGTLGYKESFSGRGYLDFINTFKREANLLDIPIEIMGRIGFDLGLFVPVIGKLDFEMTEGKIFLRELKNTYSEGKRSRFYLPGHKESYIGLDGNIFIDIKMKQYVLLKITEPFTLSIRGSLLKPRYSLR